MNVDGTRKIRITSGFWSDRLRAGGRSCNKRTAAAKNPGGGPMTSDRFRVACLQRNSTCGITKSVAASCWHRSGRRCSGSWRYGRSDDPITEAESRDRRVPAGDRRISRRLPTPFGPVTTSPGWRRCTSRCRRSPAPLPAVVFSLWLQPKNRVPHHDRELRLFLSGGAWCLPGAYRAARRFTRCVSEPTCTVTVSPLRVIRARRSETMYPWPAKPPGGASLWRNAPRTERGRMTAVSIDPPTRDPAPHVAAAGGVPGGTVGHHRPAWSCPRQ